jgi:hypothetical protein
MQGLAKVQADPGRRLGLHGGKHGSPPGTQSAAQQRIGEYYKAGTKPGGGAVADPIQYSCQQNYHLLTTDGQWNNTGASGTVGSTNYDNTLPSTNPDLLPALNAEFGTSFTAGGAWPGPTARSPAPDR